MLLLLLLLLLCACSQEKGPPPDEVDEPTAQVRFLPAEMPEDGGWSKHPGEVLANFRALKVGPGELYSYQQFDKLMLVQDNKATLIADQVRRFRILERLDRDHLLVTATRDLGVLELSTGRLARLDATPPMLVSLDRDRLYLLKDGYLQDTARKLSERRLDTLLDEDRDSFYALAGQEVYRIFKAGGEERVGKCPVPPKAFPSLSPDHGKLALGLEGGRLEVYDLKSGELLRQVENIPVAVSKISGRVAPVRVGWMDDRTVRYSVSEHTSERDPEFYGDRVRDTPEGYFRFRDLDLLTGQTRDRQRYARLGLQHAIPSAQVEREERLFQMDEINLWVPKSKVMYAAISFDGRRAALHERFGMRGRVRLLLLDEKGQSLEVAQGPRIREGTWLSAVGPVPWCPAVETGVCRSGIFPDRTLRFFPKVWQ